MRPLTTSDRVWPVLGPLMRGHARIYRATGGRIGRKVPGLPPLLLLDHVGAKSSKLRTVPLAEPLVEHNPTYETYGQLTDRTFPIVLLRPRG